VTAISSIGSGKAAVNAPKSGLAQLVLAASRKSSIGLSACDGPSVADAGPARVGGAPAKGGECARSTGSAQETTSTHTQEEAVAPRMSLLLRAAAKSAPPPEPPMNGHSVRAADNAPPPEPAVNGPRSRAPSEERAANSADDESSEAGSVRVAPTDSRRSHVARAKAVDTAASIYDVEVELANDAADHASREAGSQGTSGGLSQPRSSVCASPPVANSSSNNNHSNSQPGARTGGEAKPKQLSLDALKSMVSPPDMAQLKSMVSQLVAERIATSEVNSSHPTHGAPSSGRRRRRTQTPERERSSGA